MGEEEEDVIIDSSLLDIPPPKGGLGFLMSPRTSCLESQGFQFDPTFLYLSSVLLPSPVALSVLSLSAFGQFS